MDATREHVSAPAEWLTAALFLLATIFVGLLVVRELRVLPRSVPPAEQAAPSVQIPAAAVSVPSLTLGSAREIRVGDAVSDALARLEGNASLEQQSTGRGPFGSREVRAYSLAGTRIYFVFEPFEMRGAPRVAGIYLE